MMIRLGENLALQVPTSEGKRYCFVGKSGMGKTNDMLVMASELMREGWTVAIIDPQNQFRGLRTANLPILVAGARPSADVKLTPQNAPLLAEFSFAKRASVVLDVSMYDGDTDVLQPFLETLWRQILMQHEDGPFVRYAVFVDEAQLYIPEGGKTSISSLILDMTKRGRYFHLSIVAASQRPASVQKNFITQTNMTIYHAVRSADIVPLKEDLPLPVKDVRAMMRKFGKGQAIVVADADVIDMDGEDYLVAQVDEWGKSSPAPTLETVTASPVIDGDVLNALRVAMLKEGESEPIESSSQMMMTIAPHSEELVMLRKQNQNSQSSLARSRRIITALILMRDLENAAQKRVAELETQLANERSKADVVRKVVKIPGVDIEGRVNDAGQFKITRKTTHIETIEGNHQSTRQLQVKINRQQRSFEELMSSLKGLRLNCMAILMEVLTRPEKRVHLTDVAIEYDYALSNVGNGLPALITRGLVTRDNGIVYSHVDAVLAESFPALDAHQLRARLMELVEERLGN